MLAKPVDGSDLTTFTDVAFEPKWDGFRCLVFRSLDAVVLQGRGRSRGDAEIVDLAYAFPEVVGMAMDCLPAGTVIDTEIVVRREGKLDFAALSTRLRPRSASHAASIATLARELPATMLAFDLLGLGEGRMGQPYHARRHLLAEVARDWPADWLLTPMTRDPAVAQGWFDRFESAGVDGLMVKPLQDPYQPGRRVQWKVKHQRTADVVVAGWRPQQAADGSTVVGALLLGLHDEADLLHYVGAASAFTAQRRRELVDELAPYAVSGAQPHPWLGAGGNRVPGTANRWTQGKAWTPLAPTLVAEVSYDQMEGDRFRHPAGFLRWRPDRSAGSCEFSQLQVPPPSRIDALIGPAGRLGSAALASAPPPSSESPADTAGPRGRRQHLDPTTAAPG